MAWGLRPIAAVPRVHVAIALTLTALGLAPGAAHVMELPVKVRYAAPRYADVTSTLYLWYGIAGGVDSARPRSTTG